MRRSIVPALAASSIFLLGACGTSTQASEDDKGNDTATGGPITLTDSADRTVELDAPAERVVVLEWQQIEDVLTLGVDPVGAADVKGYNLWDTAVELDADTADVGTRGEPNMDAIFSTNPDLVIVEAERGDPVIKQLEKYDVPVLVTQGADAADPIGNMKDTFTLIAQALGKEDQAEEVLEEFDAHLAEAKEAIEAAELETTEFAYADAWIDGSNIAIRPFGQGSLVGELGEEIGLTNVWKGEVDAAYGLGQTDVEGLTAIGDAHFFFTSTDALTDAAGYAPWMPALEKNQIWKNAKFVKADRVHAFPAGIWTFGGPKSSQQVIDGYVAALSLTVALLHDTRATDPGASTQEALGVRGALGATAALVSAAALLVVVAGWHLTQGTSGIDAGDLVDLTLGGGDQETLDVLLASRFPRMLAGLAVGLALGAAGALFQSLVRNSLAAPDTLAVNAGAYFAIVLCTVIGVSLPLLGESLVAFLGGLLAAAVVLLLGGGGGSTTRLILAGSALTLALAAATAALLLLFDQKTIGLYAWGNGNLTQLGLDAVRQMAPVIGLALLASLLLARRLDLLGLGDDTAHVLGVPVLRTRVLGYVAAVTLACAAVTLAGPIGFVGLCAPAAVRLLARFVPAVSRHLVLIPLSAITGALIVLLSDALMRLFLGADVAISVPTGVATTLLGALVLVFLARGTGDPGPLRQPPAARPAGRHSRARRLAVIVILATLLAGATLFGLMSGYTWLLLGDLATWAEGNAVPVVRFAMDERAPRVAAAIFAGAALALSGTVVQAVCRNPLAEPGLLGITGGAGVGAVIVVTTSATVATTADMALAAAIGGLAAFALVYALAWRGGLNSDRLVLVGIGVWFGTTALTTLLVVRANPWDTPRIFTWLSGSTYGRTWDQVLPVLVAVLVMLPLVWLMHRHLDLVAVDNDTPRLVGIRLERLRLLVLVGAAILASTAVSAVGVVGFVGLVAPHAARALVSGRHLYVIPTAVLLGALLLSLADTLGRSVIAPAQIPAGLVVALVGAPYFLWLLYRSRA